MSTLLEKAKAATTHTGRKETKFSEEEIELALSWANDEVALFQVQAAMKFNNTAHCYVWLARCLRHIISSNGKTEAKEKRR